MLMLTICIALSLLRCYSATPVVKRYDDLNSRTSFAGNLQKFLNSNRGEWVSSECWKQLLQYEKSLTSEEPEDFWAMQMFDAGGKIPSGILEGNLAELGSFDECLNIKAEISPTEEILGQYCLGSIGSGGQAPINEDHRLRMTHILDFVNPERRSGILNDLPRIQLATCFPSGCSAADINKVYSKIGVNLSVTEQFCQTKASTELELDGGAIATISVFGVIFGMMVVSTAYDVFLHYSKKETLHPALLAFSVSTNTRKLLSTSKAPNQISCLNGIRVISTMWVILGHRYTTQTSFPIRNLIPTFDLLNDQANMFIIGATISVDTFFLMSGLLISYCYISAVTKGTKFNIILYYLHRYLRLTPLLAAVIVILVTLVKYFGSGPLYPVTVQRDLTVGCEDSWWTALLYIQNYVPGGTCLQQGWYLNLDMQLFILSPIVLLPLKRWPKYAMLGTGFLTICSILSCFLTAWFMKLHNNMLGNTDRLAFNDYYYTALHTRAAPWLIGIMTGYFIFAIKQGTIRFNINKATIIILWIVSLAVLCTCVFAGHDLLFGEYDRLANSLHIALVRPSWAVALGYIIVACVTGNGGPVNWFLSLPVFEVVSKLTYAQYLSHFAVIVITTAQMRSTITVSNPYLFYVFWGDYMFTLFVSYILTLAFESPMVQIEKLIFGRATRKEAKRVPNNKPEIKSTETA